MIIHDSEFGEVIVRRNAWVRGVKFSISTSGRLQMSVPAHTGQFLAKRFLRSNAEHIRQHLPVNDPATQRARDAKKKLLTKQAREYLPYRLEYLARRHGYKYAQCKLTHAGTRWGSCRTNGNISLNIGLMNLPMRLSDYVLLHELAHLNHPDHSRAFWQEVALHDPNYRAHRQELKQFSPGV